MHTNREEMKDEEKAALRPYFATKKAWHRHIAAVLEEARLQRDLLQQDSVPASSWIDLAEFARAEADTIRSQFGQRSITPLGDDFIRDAHILFDWKRRKGKRLYRRYMARVGRGL